MNSEWRYVPVRPALKERKAHECKNSLGCVVRKKEKEKKREENKKEKESKKASMAIVGEVVMGEGGGPPSSSLPPPPPPPSTPTRLEPWESEPRHSEGRPHCRPVKDVYVLLPRLSSAFSLI